MTNQRHRAPLAPSLVTGLVLAGGRGARMGGADKGLQLLHGRPLVEQVIARLSPQVGRLIISANRNLPAYAAFGHPVVADRVPGYAGPLAGLHAGLSNCTTPLLVLAPCDAPALPQDLVARLLVALTPDEVEIAVPETPAGLQPTFSLMRREVLASLNDYIHDGGRRMQAWCHSRKMRAVRFEHECAFANLNTPESLESYRHG